MSAITGAKFDMEATGEYKNEKMGLKHTSFLLCRILKMIEFIMANMQEYQAVDN
jgi:hypothetical protein